jgi:hypothetical protein
MKHIYESKKSAEKDVRVFLGYSLEKNLETDAKAELDEAQRRLSMLAGKDLLSIFLAFHRSGLTVNKPPRKPTPPAAEQ